LKDTWSKANTAAPAGPAEAFHYDRNEDASNPQLEETLEALAEAYENARLDLQALYNYKGKDFIEKWNKISQEERKGWMNIVRSNVVARAEVSTKYKNLLFLLFFTDGNYVLPRAQ
jgi:hypothetical protein